MSENSFSFDIDPRRDLYVRLVGDLHMALDEAMEEEGLNKTDIANSLGINKSVVTRRLTGTANITFESLADLAWALNRRVKISLVPLNHLRVGNNHFTPATVPGRLTSMQESSNTSRAITYPVGQSAPATQKVGAWQ